jgi:hypothetical protein
MEQWEPQTAAEFLGVLHVSAASRSCSSGRGVRSTKADNAAGYFTDQAASANFVSVRGEASVHGQLVRSS